MTEKNFNAFVTPTPFGKIECISNSQALLKINLNASANATKPKTALEKKLQAQLESFFEGERRTFSIPLMIESSAFQARVCQALQKIPLGTTVTYGALARQLGSSPRAVGGGCRRNPIPLIIPCHRVVASEGIGGFSGTTSGKLVSAKQWLLNHEQEVASHGSC